MIILDVNKVTKSYGFGEILDEVSFSVNDGERVAIVGENGCGKSTLLKIIAKIEDKDGGTISTKKDTILEYLEQGDVLDTQSGKCVDIINSAFSNLFKIDEELKELENKMCDTKDENELNSFVKRYCALNEKFTSLGGYEIKIKVDMVFNGLKIDKNLLERDFSTLSGGERTLINLARILLSNPNLLLLDEPTNHLDISRIEWLESYINNFKGTIIVVSHDRRFLDKVARKIIELENGKIKTYVGNYSQYLQQKEDEEVKEFEIYKVQQKKIKAMEEAIKRLKEWGEMGNNPTFFRRAKAIQMNLDRLKNIAIEKPEEKRSLPINFQSGDRGADNVLITKDLTLQVGDKVLLNHCNCIVKNKDKVALIGDNGTGKSTFIKAILSGNENIKLDSKQKIGYLSQVIEFEDNNEKLLPYFMSETGLEERLARSVLFKFLFYKNDVFKRVGDLSGGEKIRLKLAVMLQKNVNFLILDEPTNHIDISTREVLEETLKEFKGTILFVSHDRYFIDKIATKVIELKNEKLITYEGNYADYLLEKEKQLTK